MDHLINFDMKGSLFECKMSDFDDTIKTVLTKIISIKPNEHHRSPFYNFEDEVKCMMCLQWVRSQYLFAICNNCVRCCTYGFRGPLFVERLATYGKRFYIGLVCDDVILTFLNINNFINNSHKLFHRFYQIVPILFILSINDENSLTHVLNNDIIMYIIKIIYL